MASFQSWDRTADDDSGEGGYFVYVVLRLLLSVFANGELAAHVNSACWFRRASFLLSIALQQPVVGIYSPEELCGAQWYQGLAQSSWSWERCALRYVPFLV